MFIPLFNKSNYTLLSSLLTVDDIIGYAKKHSLSHISIVDTSLYGAMEFIHKCERENIVPVIGFQVLLEDFSYVLFAKSYKGYQNLIKLSTIQSERKIELKDIQKYNKEVIAVLPCTFLSHFDFLKDIYVDFYLGYTNKKEENEARIYSRVVFFRENLYLTSKDQEYLSYLYRIRDGKTLLDKMDYSISAHALEIEDPLEFSSEEGLKNTFSIVKECHLEFPEAENLLPIYDCDDPKKYLFDLCRVGLKKRLGKEIPDFYKKRLLYELKVIHEMGFDNYFLVVYDFIRFAKKSKILVGPGRGSAAGSLVAYSLGITDIDPIEYDLLFERFLNPERKTMPDIDTDFPDNKRDLVIDYVKKKYGEKRVSGIITFGTLAAKQALRDVARVFNVPIYKVDSLCKFIPAMSKEKLSDIYKENEAFRVRIESDSLLQDVFKVASRIEGFPRHTSSHAAGIVMSRVDLDEVIPLVREDNMYLTGYSMEYLEELGLLKMDFLVLKNLTLIDNILKDIYKVYQKEVDFTKIPLDDRDTLHLFETADTCGIFQFESAGMRIFLRKLKPNTFEDIFAAIALFRPGAAVNIDSYIQRKHGLEKITYLDPVLEQVTKSTYGFLIYQEQIMQVASLYAGYSLGEADILRRAMSKKKLELLKGEEEKFLQKSIEKGHNPDQAKHLFDLILNFAGYGFNKSHSVVYSIIAYKMTYLKCHYPTIFFANLLTNVIGSESKTNEYIMEARACGIEIEKPNIEDSSSYYVVKNQKIIYPISNIKGVGIVVSEQIEKAKEAGPFLDIYDCFSRLYIAGIGKKILEDFIYANLFAKFGFNRATLIYHLDSLFNYAELTKDIDPSLVMKPELDIQEEYSSNFLLEKEKELFGLYLSSHPITMYKKKYPDCVSLNQVKDYFNRDIIVLVLVDKIKIITTKNGDKMAFVTGSDETGSLEFTFFPSVFQKENLLEKGALLKIKGHVEKRLSVIQIIVETVWHLKEEEYE